MRTKGALGKHARRHGHYSGPSGYHARKFDRASVVAWDGEGFRKPDGSRFYGLLMSSVGVRLENPDGIRTLDALECLSATAARSGRYAYHVGFGISYDVNMMLGDAPRAKVQRIADGERTLLGGRFVVRYTPAKSLWVKDRRTSTSMTLYDTYGFHQVSFVRAVEKMLGAGDRRLNIVRAGKERREDFTWADLSDVKRYTAMELELTVEMTMRVVEGLRRAGLQPSRLDGAGAVAAAMLKKYGVRAYMGVTPDDIHTASCYAYAGGRTEMPRVGYHLDGGWRSDMRSAYPTICQELPCLAHGRWRHRPDGDFRFPFALACATWDYSDYGYADGWLFPFPLRSERGAIYYPAVGKNWVWRPELDAARRVRRFADDERLNVIDGWEWEPACAHRPFAFIPDVYAERRRLKGAGDSTEMAYKLGLNSLYGKTAQHVGGTVDAPPPYHQLEWAGYITSATRARLFTAALKMGRGSVVSMMTDGILTTKPVEGHLDAPVGPNLGEWEVEPFSRLVSAQSGVYFFTVGDFESSCPKCGTDTVETPMRGWRCPSPLCRATNYTAHFRGFNPNAIDPDEILATWARMETEVPTVVRHFYTMRECLRSDGQWTRWRTWADVPRVLDAHATGKRTDVLGPPEWNKNRNPSMGLMDTFPTDPMCAESWPYVLPWDVPTTDEDSEGLVGDKEQVSIL